MKFDMHVHSCHSRDAATRPETLIRRAKLLGIDIAITDHGTISAYAQLKKLGRENDVSVICGEEIKVYEKGNFLGELSALFLQDEIKSHEFPEVIDEIKEQDALLYAPHPFDIFRKRFRKLNEVTKKLDAIESFNSRCYLNYFNRQAEAFAKANNLCKIAGSDAHFPQEIGRALTLLKCEDLESVRKEIKKHNTLIYGEKTNPIIHFYTFLRKRRILKEA